VLASKIGLCPQKELRKAGLEPFEAYDVIDKVALDFYEQFMKSNELTGVS
jgi:nitrogen fixation protein NifB